jgi:hypothetical protein
MTGDPTHDPCMAGSQDRTQPLLLAGSQDPALPGWLSIGGAACTYVSIVGGVDNDVLVERALDAAALQTRAEIERARPVPRDSPRCTAGLEVPTPHATAAWELQPQQPAPLLLASTASPSSTMRPGVNFADAKLTPCGRNE